MKSIKKTIRISSSDWGEIERKLLKSNKTFSEFARESFKKSRIKEYRPPYETGFSDFQLIGWSIGATLVSILILINTLIPIRYVSLSDWIIPIENRYVVDGTKYIFFDKSEITKDTQGTDNRYIEINSY